jgi:acetoin utilization protein AcuB
MMKDEAEPSMPTGAAQLGASEPSGVPSVSTAFRKRARRSIAHRSDIAELQVSEFMTLAPHTIGDDQSVSDGYRILRQFDIRHLPVLHGGKLVGLLSQRDLHFLGSPSNEDNTDTPVSEAMSPDTYAVGPHEALRHVAAEMAEHRYGSAVVVEQGRVIGIFTTADAVRALSVLLTSQATVAG